MDDLTRNIWANELIKPLDFVIGLYDEQVSDNVCIADEQDKALAVLCDYANSLLAVHTDEDIIIMLKLRYFMSYIWELTYKYTTNHSETHYFCERQTDSMTNSKKYLTLVQVMTNIAGPALAGAESIVASVCSQVDDIMYYNSLQDFYGERIETKILFNKQFKNWLREIEEFDCYRDIQYSVNSLFDIPVVSYHVLYPDKGLTEAQRSSAVDFIQKMVELVQETYTECIKDCELLKDTDPHFASIENLLYMIMKYTIDILTKLKGILAEDNAVTETTFFSRKD